MNSRAVFLDKDGTLVDNVPYNVDPDRIQFSAGAIDGLRLLHAAGYALIVISNQSGVARGYFPESAILAVEQCLRERLAIADIPLAGFYYCPHHPAGSVMPYAISCDCRKPQPGLLYQAAAQQGIDFTQSWFIGDILDDVEAGRAVHCRTILIDNGNETEWQLSPHRLPHHLANNLDEAAHIILAIDQARERTGMLQSWPQSVEQSRFRVR